MIEGLFTHTRRSAEPLAWDVSLNLEHEIFRVHFPGNPILPGACQLELFRQLVSETAGVPMQIDAIKNLKYLKIVDPRETTRLSVQGTVEPLEEGACKCALTVAEGETVFTKISFTARPE